jgi:hypothetical protein
VELSYTTIMGVAHVSKVARPDFQQPMVSQSRTYPRSGSSAGSSPAASSTNTNGPHKAQVRTSGQVLKPRRHVYQAFQQVLVTMQASTVITTSGHESTASWQGNEVPGTERDP